MYIRKESTLVVFLFLSIQGFVMRLTSKSRASQRVPFVAVHSLSDSRERERRVFLVFEEKRTND